MVSRITKSLIFLMLSSLLSFAYAGQKNMNQDSLWQIIKQLKSAWGKQADDVSKILRHPLVRTNPAADDRYTSVPFTLADGTIIADLDVRLWGNGNNSVSLISFAIDGSCVTLEQVKKHFPDVKLSNIPRGNNAGQSVGYRTAVDETGLAWAFNFPVLNQECLKSIVISRYDR